MANQFNLYDVLSDTGHRPKLYSIETMGELRSFVEGYQCALKLHGLPTESPPFHQFAHWLVRRLGRGHASCGWWTTIQWEDTDDATAIAQFGVLIDEFALRVPHVVAEVEFDRERHTATGRFRLERLDAAGELVVIMAPNRLRIRKYATDVGYYLEYEFAAADIYERYYPDLQQVLATATADFRVVESDWVWK